MEWAQLLKIPIADKVEKEQLKDLVPQKGKMFLLDSVESYDLKTMTITCLKEISEDNIFYKADLEGIPAFTSFEMMAQAIAALQTIKKIKNQEEEPNPGVILTLSKFKSNIHSFSKGTEVCIQAEEEYNSNGLCCYICQAFARGKEAEAVKTKITAMEIKDLSDLLKQ